MGVIRIEGICKLAQISIIGKENAAPFLVAPLDGDHVPVAAQVTAGNEKIQAVQHELILPCND